MAVRVWLDKDGKVLVSPEGNVYLSEECCCLKEPDPTVCWQLYSATVTTSEDGSSKGWSEPWMVDYTCLVSGSEPPGAAEWRYAPGGATLWVSFSGMCSECSVPHGAEKPGLNVECIMYVSAFVAPYFMVHYLYPATVVTYMVERDADGASVGQNQIGSTVVPSWELTALTPDDTDDYRYSQVIGVSAKSIAIPLLSKGEPPYTDYSTTAVNTYVLHDGCQYPLFPIGNGVSLLRTYGNQGFPYIYATGAQGVMSLSLVGSRYSAVPLQPTDEVTSKTYIYDDYHERSIYFRSNEWGNLEVYWELQGDQWYAPYLHITEYRVAAGGMTPLSECSSYVGSLDTHMSMDAAPLWSYEFALQYDIPMRQAADHALSQVFYGDAKFLTARVCFSYAKCVTWWHRLLGMAWDGCPKDQVIFDGWTTLWSREDTPEYLYLDTLVPMTVSNNLGPFGMYRGTMYHEDDDALVAGSTVMRPFSSELGDGHVYWITTIDIHNFPSWRTDLCSTAFTPVTAEVPNLKWRQTDYLLSGYAPWPLKNLHITSMYGNGWYAAQSSRNAIGTYSKITYFTYGELPDIPITIYDNGDRLYEPQYYTWYDILGTPHSSQLSSCVVITDVGEGHKPGAKIVAEMLAQGSKVVSTRTDYVNRYSPCVVTYSSYRYHAYGSKTIDTGLLDGKGFESWKNPSATPPPAFFNISVSRDFYRLWLFDELVTACSDGIISDEHLNYTGESGMPLNVERALSANPQLPRDWYQWSAYTGAYAYLTGIASALYVSTSSYRGNWEVSSNVGGTHLEYVSVLEENSYVNSVSVFINTVYQGVGVFFSTRISCRLYSYLHSELARRVLYSSYYRIGSARYGDTTVISTAITIGTMDHFYTASFYRYGDDLVYWDKLAISSLAYAPSIRIYLSSPGIQLNRVAYETVTTAAYYTSIYKGVSYDSFVGSSTAERPFIDETFALTATSLFPPITLGAHYEPLGYVKGSVTVEPGKVTGNTTMGSYGTFSGNTSGSATRMNEATYFGEVHYKWNKN